MDSLFVNPEPLSPRTLSKAEEGDGLHGGHDIVGSVSPSAAIGLIIVGTALTTVIGITVGVAWDVAITIITWPGPPPYPVPIGI